MIAFTLSLLREHLESRGFSGTSGITFNARSLIYRLEAFFLRILSEDLLNPFPAFIVIFSYFKGDLRLFGSGGIQLD